MAVCAPFTAQVSPFMAGKATCAGRTRVPSATLGTWLAGGVVPRTTQSSSPRNSARKVSLNCTTVPVGYGARLGA